MVWNDTEKWRGRKLNFSNLNIIWISDNIQPESILLGVVYRSFVLVRRRHATGAGTPGMPLILWRVKYFLTVAHISYLTQPQPLNPFSPDQFQWGRSEYHNRCLCRTRKYFYVTGIVLHFLSLHTHATFKPHYFIYIFLCIFHFSSY